MTAKLILAATTAAAAASAAALAGAPSGPNGERVDPLPSVTRAMSASTTGTRCAAGVRTPVYAQDVMWSAAGRSAILARLTGSRRTGDWDLLALDARGRSLDAARGHYAREAVQALVPARGSVTIRACRLRGGKSRVPLRIDAVGLDGASRPPSRQSLLKVTIARRQDAEVLRSLGLDLGEDGMRGELTVVAHGPADIALVRRAGFPFRVVEADLRASDARDRAVDARAAAPSVLPSGRTTYRTYEEIQDELKTLVAANPDIARAIAVPLQSSQGREISGIEIAAGDARDGRPTFALVGLHHAREWPAAEVGMELLYELLKTKNEADTKQLLSSIRIVAIPVQNPDGYAYSRGNEQLDPDPDGGNTQLVFGGPTGDHGPYRRKTCGGPLPPAAPCDLQPGADSNRNYGPMWGGIGSSTIPTEQDYQGEAPWSEPETEGYHQLLQKTNATVVLSMHNVLGAVLRAPGVLSDGPSPDDAGMKSLGDRLGKMTGYNSTSFAAGLGYDGSGITEDWAYGALGAYTYTIEVGGDTFHGAYADHVVKQWEGPKGKGGLRLALRTIAAAAADRANHGVLSGHAPAGATLRLKRAFKTQTRPICAFSPGITARNAADPAQCVGAGDPIELDDKVEFEMAVPASREFAWHVPPSTRPFEGKAGKAESYTLSCERDGKVVEQRDVVLARGAALSVGYWCGEVEPAPVVTPAAKAKPKKKKAKRKKKKKKRSRRSLAGFPR